MKEIAFSDIVCKSGHIQLKFVETIEGKTYSDSIYIDFDTFIPSSNQIALILGTFCGKAYNKVHMDIEISEEIFNFLNDGLNADFTINNFLQENSKNSEKNIQADDEKMIILNFSGGLDSLALYYCLPKESCKLVSVYFDGFERESEMFRRFPTHIVRTDARKKITLDSNSWEFMGFGSILYKDYLHGRYTTFGTVLEAGNISTIIEKSNFINNRNYFNSSLELLFLSNSLTEVGTAMIVIKQNKEMVLDSLKSLANIGSEKLYRKECIVNAACELMGIEHIIKEYHYPRRKIKMGEYFATDFLFLFISKYLGIEYALKMYIELPSKYKQFVDAHSLSFYSKIRQDLLSKHPEELIDYFIQKCSDYGLCLYSEEDYHESKEVGVFLDDLYKALPEESISPLEFILSEEIDKIHAKTILLYGAGRVGKDYYNQLVDRGVSVHWIDGKYMYYQALGFEVYSPEDLPSEEFDLAILATINETFSNEMYKHLIDKGIPNHKIVNPVIRS